MGWDEGETEPISIDIQFQYIAFSIKLNILLRKLDPVSSFQVLMIQM